MSDELFRLELVEAAIQRAVAFLVLCYEPKHGIQLIIALTCG